MSPRMVATVAAVASLVFGMLGLILPTAIAAALGGSVDATGGALLRLACSSYVAFGVLTFLARDLTDAGAWRAVSAASAVSWGLGAVVVAIGTLSALVGVQAWFVVAMQILFTLAWSRVYARA